MRPRNAEIFSIPRAWRFSVAGVIGRLPMSMYGLGTVLLISAGTGRYGLAGTVAASGALGNAFCAPQLGRLVDRLGQHRVLVPICVIFALSVAGMVTAVQLRFPGLDAVRMRDRRRRDHAAARADGAGPLVGAAGGDVAAAHRLLDRVDRGRALLHRRARRRHPARHPGAPGSRGVHRRDLLPGGNAVVRGPARDRAPGQYSPPGDRLPGPDLLIGWPNCRRSRSGVATSRWRRRGWSCWCPRTCSSARCSCRSTCRRWTSPPGRATSRWRG